MDLLEAIRTRRTIRNYSPAPVDQDSVTKVIEAANWAPSWGNTQCWRFVVIRNENTRYKIADTLQRVWVDNEWVENAAMNAIKQAPVLIVVCAELGKAGYRHDGTALTNKAESWFIFDVALAMQNIALVAHDLGLGTCIIGGFDANKVEDIIGIPEKMCVVTMTPLGVPAQPGQVSPRKNIAEVMFTETLVR